MKVALIDYGSGNLRSVAKATQRAADESGLNADVSLVTRPDDVLKADRVILPGVGAFGDCRQGLDALPGMIDALTEVVFQKHRPFLGICVGMQLLATKGFEHGEFEGLNWISGTVVPVPENLDAQGLPLRIPHMGWNTLDFVPGVHPLLDGIPEKAQVYFVHSYHFVPGNEEDRVATVSYGQALSAVVARETIVGTQFHPEKSQAHGLRILSNFLSWAP